MRARDLTVLCVVLAALAVQAQTESAAYSDPFAYCAAVRTIDAPDARYSGPAVPESIARGLQKALGVAANAPLEPFRQSSFWRCMDGKLYACTVGANLPCQAKAQTQRTPSPATVAYCKTTPQADVVPMFVTGRETVYEWRCRAGAPEIVRQFTTPDARGFLSNIWYALPPP